MSARQGGWFVSLGAVLLLAVLLVACGENGATVRIAAASDVRAAFEVMREEMEAACECEVVFVFGSSGLLSEQIAAGAPFALYFSADEQFALALAEAGDVLPGSVARYARGRLAIAWRDGVDPVREVGELARDDLARIAIANPGHAPYGRAAREAMEQAGVWAQVEPRIVYGENVRQATDYVVSGDADAGIVALPLVIGTDANYEAVPAGSHPPLVQAAGVVRGVNEAAAQRVLRYVTSEAGQRVLRDFGFEAP